MDSMHARRHDEQIQNSLQLNRQSPVGMMKKRCSLECNKEDDQHYRRDAKERDRKGKKSNRENHFAEMKSRCGCHIEVEIGVVHVMKAPEDWDHVVDPMPPPIGVIHQQKRCDDSGPVGEWEPVQQTDPPMLRPQCH